MSKTDSGAPRRVNARLWALIALAIAFACGWGQSRAAPFPNADHSRFNVTVTGHGPDIILIPGWGSSTNVWQDTVDNLKGRYRLHLVQVSGFAGEPAGANADGEVLTPLVNALKDYIEAQGLNRPVIIGHSMGGFTGLLLAYNHPDSLSQLIIVDSLPYYPLIFHPNPTPDALRPSAEALRGGLESMSDDAFHTQQTAGLSRQATSLAHQALILEATTGSDRGVLGQALYDLLLTDARPHLGNVRSKVTLIYPHSPETGFTPEQTDLFYKTAYADLKTIQFQRIDNSLHFIMYDQPERFAEVLAGVLSPH